MTRTEQEIRRIIQDQAYPPGRAGRPLTEEEYAKTLRELDFDSLDVVELVISVETTFGVEVSDEDAEKFKDLSASGLAGMVDTLRATGPKYKRASEASR
ncbi:MAG: Acyl carrier protein [Candidatus Omnitrophica bacterium]|nr:Acyl carrier protein [Candidatus Omnitrophota bacterium]